MRQRNISHVGKCKRRSGSVTSNMLASAREDIPHVGKCKRRCGSVTSCMLASAREYCSDKNAKKRTLLLPPPPLPLYPPLPNTTLRAVGEKRPQLVSRWWFQSLDDMKMYKLSGAPNARVTKKRDQLVFSHCFRINIGIVSLQLKIRQGPNSMTLDPKNLFTDLLLRN